MNKRLTFKLHAALVGLAGTMPAFGQYGGLDGTFTPVLASPGALGQACYGVVQQADRSLLVFGAFRTVNDLPGNTPAETQHIAKFSSGGVLDRNYFPRPNNYVNGVVAEFNGSMLAGGGFASVNTGLSTQLARPLIARFQANGQVDGTFHYTNPGQLSSVNNLAAHAGSGYLVSADAGMFKITSTGAIDTGFNVYQGGLLPTVWTARPLADDKILINGGFTTLNGRVNNVYLERLSINGGVDSPGFTPNPAMPVYIWATAVQADGKILVGGPFGPNSGGYPTVGLTRLLSNGAIDPAFSALHAVEAGRAFLDGAVRCIALQADGKILIGGDFINIRTGVKVNNQWQYVERRGVARLNPDGSLDTTFNANITGANFSVNCITIQDSGHVLIGGTFQIVGGSNRPLVARLINGEATQSLTYSGGQILWDRGGSSPDVTAVKLEYRSATSGSDWQLVDNIGIAIRNGATGSWIRPVTNAIPPNSYIRASGRVSAGTYSGSSGIVSQTIPYQVPRVALRRDTPFTPISNGGSTDFGNSGVSWPRDVSFTLTNSGDGAMSAITASIQGADASQFSIQTPPSFNLAALGTTPLVVRFQPTSVGTKTATLRITSNDPESPFLVTLTGNAIPEQEGFRLHYFGTTENAGEAADSADPDGDGQTNLFEYIAGLVPNDRNSKFEQRVDRSSGTPKVIFSPIVAGRTYEVQTSTTLGNDWVTANGSTANNGTERTFTHTGASDPKRFYRIKITK